MFYFLTPYLLVWEENDSTEPKMNSENKTESDPNDTTHETESASLNVKCKVIGIYGLHCRTTDKWYIGQSVDIYDRWKNAYQKLKCGSQRKIYNALLKYGYDGFDKVILEQCDSVLLNDREIYWSDFYDSVDNGYNIRHCGGSRGHHNDETKKRMSIAATGRKLSDDCRKKLRDAWTERRLRGISDDTRRKMSLASSSRTQSLETRRRRSITLTGKLKSTEHRKNLSEAVKNWWKIRKQSSYPDNNIRKEEIASTVKA